MGVLLLASLAAARYAGRAAAAPPPVRAQVLDDRTQHGWDPVEPGQMRGLLVPPNAQIARDSERPAHFVALTDMTHRAPMDPLTKLNIALAAAGSGSTRADHKVTVIQRDDGAAMLRLGIDAKRPTRIMGVLVLTPDAQQYTLVYVYDRVAPGEDPAARLNHLRDDLAMFAAKLPMPGAT